MTTAKWVWTTASLVWLAGAGCQDAGDAPRFETEVAARTVADCPVGTTIIQGTAGPDTLVGTAGRDCILGYGGDDVIDGLNGDDFLVGGDGNDTLQGGNGADALYGEAGDDQLLGGNGVDVLDGGAGNDRLDGGNGGDALDGGDGNDQISGGSGADLVDGGGGDDVIDGGSGTDTVHAGDGDDVVEGSSDIVDGGPGNDACVGTGCESGAPASCTSDADCASGDTCFPATGTCLGCLADSDCDDGDACTTDTCAAFACETEIPDSDLDGAPDCTDNCPDLANSDQYDTNGDGLGDACNGEAAASVTGGSNHSCAIREGGKVYCWGYNGLGSLGNGTTTNSTTPVQVSGLDDAIAVDAGYSHTCAVRATGEVVCWGYGSYGQLGNGANLGSTIPVAVPGIFDAIAIDGAGDHTCAVRETGEVLCWGMGVQGQLGNGTTTSSSMPVPVSGLTDAIAVSGGYSVECALRATGAVACWGTGNYGQLGDGSTTSIATTPVDVQGLTDAVGVASGEIHTCAARETGEVACWGYGGSGQRGDGTTVAIATTPVTVIGLADAVAVTAGAQHTCAVTGQGEVLCWGLNNRGQLGNGSLANTSTPGEVDDVAGAAAVAGAPYHTCVVYPTGEIRCWGLGDVGQLGDGQSRSSWTPRTAFGGLDPLACPSFQHEESGVCVDDTQYTADHWGTYTRYWTPTDGWTGWIADIALSNPCPGSLCAYRWFQPYDVPLSTSLGGGFWSLEPGAGSACVSPGPGPTSIDGSSGVLHLQLTLLRLDCGITNCFSHEVKYSVLNSAYYRRMEMVTCAGL